MVVYDKHDTLKIFIPLLLATLEYNLPTPDLVTCIVDDVQLF